MSKNERIRLLEKVSKLAKLIAEANSGRMSFDSEEDFLRMIGLRPEELTLLVHSADSQRRQRVSRR